MTALVRRQDQVRVPVARTEKPVARHGQQADLFDLRAAGIPLPAQKYPDDLAKVARDHHVAELFRRAGAFDEFRHDKDILSDSHDDGGLPLVVPTGMLAQVAQRRHYNSSSRTDTFHHQVPARPHPRGPVAARCLNPSPNVGPHFSLRGVSDAPPLPALPRQLAGALTRSGLSLRWALRGAPRRPVGRTKAGLYDPAKSRRLSVSMRPMSPNVASR